MAAKSVVFLAVVRLANSYSCPSFVSTQLPVTFRGVSTSPILFRRNSRESSYFHRETSPGVTEVNFTERPATERHKIISWEQKNLCTLPEDLRNFYLMTDGFLMTWNVKFDGNPMQLGSLVINSISKLSRLGESAIYTLPNAPNLTDLEDDSDDEGTKGQRAKPSFDSHTLIFELDPCNGNGKVCLVYRNVKKGILSVDTEIWFLDRALYWHFLAETFTAYYRLLITHLGLPQWQYAFTSYGVSPQAKQWFKMYKPMTFNPSLLSEDTEAYVNRLDPNKVFRSKTKTPVTKKKLPAQHAACPKSHGSVGAAKTASPSSNTGKK